VTSPLSDALFGSVVRAKLVRWLYNAEPGKSYSERRLARLAGVPEGTVHRPLQALVAGQLIVRDDTEERPRYRAPHEDPRLKYLFLFLQQESEAVAPLTRTTEKLKRAKL